MSAIFNFLFSKKDTGVEDDVSDSSDDEVEAPPSPVVPRPKTGTRATRRHAMRKKNGSSSKIKIEGCYDPRNSTAGDDTIEEFIRAPLSRDLETIPGVAEGNAKIFREDGIETPQQLVAVYLALSGGTDNSVDLSDRFYYWLQSIGINSSRSTIVEVIARKSNSWIPGIYDGDAYY